MNEKRKGVLEISIYFFCLAAFCLEEYGVDAVWHAFGGEVAVYLLHVCMQSAQYVLALHVCAVYGLYVGNIDDGVVERGGECVQIDGLRRLLLFLCGECERGEEEECGKKYECFFHFFSVCGGFLNVYVCG